METLANTKKWAVYFKSLLTNKLCYKKILFARNE